MAGLLEIIGEYIEDQGHGTFGSDLFLARMPEAPDACVGVFEYDGGVPLETMGVSGIAVDRISIQVLVRGDREDYPGARDLAAAIREDLATITNQTFTPTGGSATLVLRVRPNGSLNPLAYDANERPLISANFDCMVEVTAP